MPRRSAAISLICGFGAGLFALAGASVDSRAGDQSAALVLCDRIAADPDKPADVKGVAEIVPSDVATAIKFCKIAAPAARRALYQLGRAYAANRQLAEAIGAYRKAADKGSTGAMVELGLLLATGSGALQDEAQARELFERAAKGGNPRALPILPRSRRTAARRRIRSMRGSCCRDRRRRIHRKHSFSSD
jgi:tetratricopeptide (TPR) repeat protein